MGGEHDGWGCLGLGGQQGQGGEAVHRDKAALVADAGEGQRQAAGEQFQQ